MTRNDIACGGSLLWAWVVAMMGGEHTLINVLVGLIVLDWVTASLGLIARGQCNNWEWRKAMQGVARKLAYFCAVIFAAYLDKAAACPDIGIDTGQKIRITILIVLVGIESSSVLKNLGLCGVTVPKWIKEIVNRMKQGGGEP